VTPLRLRILRRAARQISDAIVWWRSNRQAAPHTLEEDLREALELVRVQPLLGSRWRNVRHHTVRRLYLDRVRYHLYYRLSADFSAIEVLAFWHSARGSAPRV
jgi:plasmid stabilization system protein ParE